MIRNRVISLTLWCCAFLFSAEKAEARTSFDENVGQESRWREIGELEFLDGLSSLKLLFSKEQVTEFNRTYSALKIKNGRAPRLVHVLQSSTLIAAGAEAVLFKCLIRAAAAAMAVEKARVMLTTPSDPVPAVKCDKPTATRILDKFERTRTAERAAQSAS